MPEFVVAAYQEMYAEQTVAADTQEEAAEKFRALADAGQIPWRPSDEDLEIAEVTTKGDKGDDE